MLYQVHFSSYFVTQINLKRFLFTKTQNANIYKTLKKDQLISESCINIMIMLCILVMFVDFIGSLVLMCIKYPLIITALYHCSVGLLGGIGLMLTCCFVLPFFICYAKISSLLFSLIACGSPIDQPCGRFMRSVSNGFVLITINYLFVCAVICLCFLFVGGPNHSIIYLDLRPGSTDLLIVWLYLAATCIGCIGFVIGAANVMYQQCNNESGGKKGKKGYHQPQNNAGTTEMYEVSV